VTQYSYNDNDQLTQEVTDGNVSSYEYDDNGALVKKDAGGDPNHYYSYDLRGRLAQLQVENGVSVDYLYNPDGIRVRAAVQAGSTADYLIDPYNHTGYAQVLKEVGNANTVYIYGLDAIAQAGGTTDPKYLLYDGHGSVRQLSNNIGNSIASYSYDAYGSARGFNPAAAATKLLYAGEFFDSHLGFYYNRARWYDPAVGRFNRLDPFAGANHDPQSLHKYLYGHCNPVNGADPSGMEFSLLGMLKVATITGCISGILTTGYGYAKGWTEEKIFQWQIRSFVIGFSVGAAVYGGVWLSSSVLTAIFGAGAGFGNLQYAEDYGICSYRLIRNQIAGTALEAHHIIPGRFDVLLGTNYRDMLCVAVDPVVEHPIFTSQWQNAIAYGRTDVTIEEIWMHAQRMYADFPALLEAARAQLLNAGG